MADSPLRVAVRFEVDPRPLLAGLRAQVQQNIIRKAIRKGANLIKEDIKATAPKRSGALRTSISVKINAKANSKVAGVVGPRRGYTKQYKGGRAEPTRYAHLLEWGRKANEAKGKHGLFGGGKWWGNKVAAVAPRHLLSGPFNRKKAAYISTLLQVIRDEIGKLLK